MVYLAYQAQADLMIPARMFAGTALACLARWAPVNEAVFFRGLAAGWELLTRAGLSHERPDFGIDRVGIGAREVAVREVPVLRTPFGTLLHFKKETDTAQPPVLLVAPLSGHFATLLRNTIRTLLPEHDVFVTDWHNARDVPRAAGDFGFDDHIAHTMRFLEAIGPEAHVVAVCQPCVQVLAAAALMAQDGNPAQPRTMTLIAGPIDPRVNPTEVNELATEHSIDWFERTMISAVPPGHDGAGRRVYPGFLQLIAFVAMNPNRHARAHRDLFWHLAMGEREQAAAIEAFYDEYFAVMDLTAEFYLETVQRVFQEARLARGELSWRGNRVEPRAIRRTALLTVEGEADDICAAGQTKAAHDLCSGLAPRMKRHHLQAGVGHYGAFAGKRWEAEIYPKLRALIRDRE